MIKMSRQKAITAFFCEKYGDHVQHNQCTSSESVNLAASAEPVEDYSIQTADAEPTLGKRRKLIKDHQGNSIFILHQCKFITVNPLLSPPSQISPPSLISPPLFRGGKLISPPSLLSPPSPSPNPYSSQKN